MIEVVIVSEENTKNIYYLSPNSFQLKRDDLVVFETENGLSFGKVLRNNYEEKSNNLVLPLSKVVRFCSDGDIKQIESNKKINGLLHFYFVKTYNNDFFNL